MRPLLQLPFEIVTAFFFSASIGMAVGVVAVSFTHRLGDFPSFGFSGLLLAAATFGYFLWRAYRRPVSRVQPRNAAPTRQAA